MLTWLFQLLSSIQQNLWIKRKNSLLNINFWTAVFSKLSNFKGLQKSENFTGLFYLWNRRYKVQKKIQSIKNYGLNRTSFNTTQQSLFRWYKSNSEHRVWFPKHIHPPSGCYITHKRIIYMISDYINNTNSIAFFWK